MSDPNSRVEPSESIETSYSTNRLCIRVGGKQLWIEPTRDGSVPSDLPTELRELLPFNYVSAWNAGGRASTFEENEFEHELLLMSTTKLEAFVAEVVAVASNGDWLEHGVAVKGAGSAANITVANDGYYAVSEDPGVAPIRFGWKLIERPFGLCPARAFDEAQSRCEVYGGPWTSRSQHALALWREHRRVGLALLGCGVCDDGKKPVIGFRKQPTVNPGSGLILLRELRLASRYGGYSWGEYLNDEVHNDEVLDRDGE